MGEYLRREDVLALFDHHVAKEGGLDGDCPCARLLATRVSALPANPVVAAALALAEAVVSMTDADHCYRLAIRTVDRDDADVEGVRGLGRMAARRQVEHDLALATYRAAVAARETGGDRG